RFTVDTFKEHDEARLYEDYAHYTDTQKVAARAMQRSEELAQILAQDWQIASAEKARIEDKRKGEAKQALGPGKPQPSQPRQPVQYRLRQSPHHQPYPATNRYGKADRAPPPFSLVRCR